MGTLQWVSGEITIDPPLNWEEIQRCQKEKIKWQIRLHVDEKQKDTPEGVVLVRTCSRIVPYTEDRYKGYSIGLALQSVVSLVSHMGGHEINGHFDCWLEQPESPPSRIWVKDGIVYEDTAKIVWPNESGNK